ncbi:MAG: hypothetical protein U9R44_05845 [Candidatus Omnitrophota bacterium]|nr:hypothetical protein [Candidatus Omnitrophota bacterium]
MIGSGKAVRTVFFVLGLFVFFSAGDEAVARERNTGGRKKVKWVKSKTGLKSLMTLSKDRGGMIKEYKDETKVHGKIKRAIDRHELKEGEDAARIVKKYGEPVIVLAEEDSGLSRWVYKPGMESYFGGEKAYLFFDKNEKLLRWEVVAKKEEDNQDL